MIVYLITNKITNKRYVGQTIHSLEARWKSHLKNSIQTGGYTFRFVNESGI